MMSLGHIIEAFELLSKLLVGGYIWGSYMGVL